MKLVKNKNGMVREDKSQKLNFIDSFDPEVLYRYVTYMKSNEKKHGKGNWKKGYSKEQYLDSLMRHVMALWLKHEKGIIIEDTDHESAIIFNIQGYMREDALYKKGTKKRV